VHLAHVVADEVEITERPPDPRYIQALIAANAEDTLITDHFAPPGVPLRARALRAALEIGHPFYAGESTGAVRSVQPAGEIVRELAEGAERLLVQGARLVKPAPEPPAE
jgi:hypothetical protein